MKGTARLLLLILPFYFISCSADGGPSGALVGLLTGGVLGAVGDELRNDDDDNGNGNGSNSSNGFFGNNNNNNNNNSNNGSGSGSVTTVTGSRTDTNGDGVVDENDATTTTTLFNQGNGNNNEDDLFDQHGGLITGAIAGAAAGAITDGFRKKEIQRKYDEGYAKAKSDAIKEFYWLKRDAQKTMKDQEPPVQYRYYEVEVPAHTTSDGVLIDKHRRVIEVVE
jgi:hypothetical protein